MGNAAPRGSPRPLDVRDLRAEHLTAPMGLEELRPLLSWRVRGYQRGAQPIAYEIQVATTAERLASGQADLWATGRVESRDLSVRYAGRPLASRQRAVWRVRAWDEEGRVGGWSASASFEMGLLSPSDWTARWIGAPDDWYERERRTRPEHLDVPALASSPLLRAGFSLPRRPERARVYVAGLGLYELYVNGRKVSDRVLDPTYTNPNHRVLYVVHDVGPFLRAGANVVGVMLANGRYHTIDDKPWKAHPKVLLQLEVGAEGAPRVVLASDDRFRLVRGPLRLDATKEVGETFDARAFDPAWATTTATTDEGPAALLPAPKGALAAQIAPAIRVTERLRPRTFSSPAPGVYVFDFGQNLAGWVRLDVSAPAGTRIELRHAERLGADGRLDLKGIGPVKPGEPPFQRDVYIAAGKGRERWEPRFTYHGFRYVEVSGLPSRPSRDTVEAAVVHTDYEAIGAVQSKNDVLTRLQRAFVWSHHGNFVGIPTDCPHREKNGWTGDAQFAVDAALYNFHNVAAYRSWLRELRDAQRADGQIPGIAPTGGYGYGDELAGPTWDLALYLVPWRLWEHTGDPAVLAENWDAWMRHLRRLEQRHGGTYLLDFGIADWLPASTKTPTELMSTAAYHRAVEIARNAARVLGRTSDEAALAALLGRIKGAFRRRFVRDGKLTVATQTALATALNRGLLDDAERAAALAALVADVHAKDDHLDTGVNGAKDLLRALADGGYAALAWRIITQPTPPSFAAWLSQGATTLWEDWTGKGSLNHVYQGDVSAFFFRTLAGLEPAAPGWRVVRVRPHVVADVPDVAATVDTQIGRVGSRWWRTKGGVVHEIEVPAGATAVVELEASAAAAVTEGGRPLAEAPFVRGIEERDGRVRFETSSGGYRFVVRAR